MSPQKNLIALAAAGAIALISVPALSQTVAVTTPTAPVVAPTTTTQTTTTPARKLATQYSQFATSPSTRSRWACAFGVRAAGKSRTC